MFSFAFQNLEGLTLNAKLFDSSGAQTGATITTGFNDLGDGAYQYLATIPDGHVGTLKIYDNAQPSRCIPLSVNPVEIELNALADAILRRGRSHSDGAADDGSLYEAVGVLTQSDTVGTTLTVYESDGTTPFNTRTLTLDDTAQPVTGIA